MKMKHTTGICVMNIKQKVALTIALILLNSSIFCQESTESSSERRKEPVSTAMWNGFYGKFRLTDKLFWDAQFHYRRNGYEGTEYVGRMGQIYNRHALSYLVNKSFSVSLGPVLRLNFTPEPGNPEFEPLTLEPRIWHEYLFAMPLSTSMAYHRVRIEHRWSKSNRVGSDWVFRNRWRYKFYMNIPIGTDKLKPGGFYFTPDVEIIMQSGKTITDNPLEDLRINPSIGYVYSPRTKFSIGMMYTTRQTSDAGYIYTNRWMIRTNAYFSLDFRKKQSRVPSTRLYD